MRKIVWPVSGKSAGKIAGAALVASLLAGCSTDVLRFQDGFYPGADSLTTASVPTPQADVAGGQPSAVPAGGYPAASAAGSAAPQAYPASGSNGGYALAPVTTPGSQPAVQSAALAPAADPQTTGTTPQPTTAGARPKGWSTEGAPRVSLQPGETIYSLSRRYGVPAEEIMKANNITDASRVSPGQQLVIPGYSRGGTQQTAATTTSPAASASAEQSLNQQAAALDAQPAASAGGSYTVQSGDTLTGIASRTGISVATLRQANGLTGDAIRIGQTLSLGGQSAAPAATTVAAAQPAATDPQPTGAVEQKPAAAPQQVTAASSEQKPSGYTPPAQAAESNIADQVGNDMAAIAPETTGIGKLRWPVRGQVVTAFGAQDGGVRNDGIDISVPEGSEVKAAENGVVIYSGSGLKEYGNTVLVRHDNGLVTVYGHAKELMVERGDKVTRGQVIAQSGMTGEAERPKLHFEVRENATPVNPSGFLE